MTGFTTADFKEIAMWFARACIAIITWLAVMIYVKVDSMSQKLPVMEEQVSELKKWKDRIESRAIVAKIQTASLSFHPMPAKHEEEQTIEQIMQLHP